MNKLKVLKVILLLKIILKRRSRRRPRSCWVRSSLQMRRALYVLKNLKKDDKCSVKKNYFKGFTRMDFSDFEILYQKVYPYLLKKDTNYREAISPLEKLCVTLKFLATGDNYDTLSYIFRISKTAISIFIPLTCQIIVIVLQNYLQTPKSPAMWKTVESNFANRWNFPHCLGAIDGRHCAIKPKFSSSEFYNYKNFFSVVLMAISDAEYKFIYIDIGAQGRMSDGAVFQATSFRSKLEKGELNLPLEENLPGRTRKTPYVFVADDAFALTHNITKPIPGITEDGSLERNYNYRVCRARMCIENVFGILSARFRVLRHPMHLKVQNVKLVIMATCYLHNFIISSNASRDALYASPGFCDVEDSTGNVTPGEWRKIDRNDPKTGFIPLNKVPRKPATDAKEIRKEFMEYFSTQKGKVPWPIPISKRK